VTVTVQGKDLPVAVVAPGCLAAIVNLVREVVRRILGLFK
jgi:hypothetical protein